MFSSGVYFVYLGIMVPRNAKAKMAHFRGTKGYVTLTVIHSDISTGITNHPTLSIKFELIFALGKRATLPPYLISVPHTSGRDECSGSP